MERKSGRYSQQINGTHWTRPKPPPISPFVVHHLHLVCPTETLSLRTIVRERGKEGKGLPLGFNRNFTVNWAPLQNIVYSVCIVYFWALAGDTSILKLLTGWLSGDDNNNNLNFRLYLRCASGVDKMIISDEGQTIIYQIPANAMLPENIHSPIRFPRRQVDGGRGRVVIQAAARQIDGRRCWLIRGR